MTGCYGKFSVYYDKLNDDCDYLKWSQYLIEQIKKHSEGKFGMDLACGTGRITVLFKQAGFDVVGLDKSSEMLSAAALHAKTSGQNLTFLQGDLKNFKTHRPCDFFTVVNDGINYIKREELLKTFKNLYTNLKKGGVLLFDISSAYKLKNILGSNLFFDDREELSLFWQNTLCGDILKMQLTFFVKKGELYERFDETHEQTAYEEKEITETLQKAGFSGILCYDCFTENPAKSDSLRLQFIAKKI